MKQRIALLLMVISPYFGFADSGKWINPISDICWSCLFPIHIAGSNMTPKYRDTYTYTKAFCHCSGGLVGLPISFWEPSRLVEVTRVPYKLMSFGGITLASSDIRKRGTVYSSKGRSAKSFYHVHYYQFPILKLLELGGQFVCIEDFDLDIGYMSEFDPFWGDDEWSTICHPEAFLFSNPAAQAACIPDCVSSSFNRSIDKLFWCAGCQGSVYPYVGYVAHHMGGIQVSSLLVHRLLAKLHSIGMLKGFTEGNFCKKERFWKIKKSLYKTQLIYPVAQTKGPCNALGKSPIIWGANKSYPMSGEDFIYLIWTKRHCCLDPAKTIKKISTGGLS